MVSAFKRLLLQCVPEYSEDADVRRVSAKQFCDPR